ncbi:MAG: hypothetical protein HQ492_02990 [Woeseiaceae bacterium]|nr:hypothetical protein [Woeseiaceae bacterium]
MSANKNRVFAVSFVFGAMFATFPALGQDTLDDVGPAVDTSAFESVVDETTEVEADIGPAVDTSANGNDITRKTSGSRVMDSIELGRTEITGNQELPKVLYIVPWKKADPGDLMGKPANSLLDEVLAPIDREEFIRQVGYYHDLYGTDEE